MMKKFTQCQLALVTLSILVTLSQMSKALADVFSIDLTLTCIADVTGKSPSLGDHSVMNCIGRSAQACMMQPGQDNTLGMISCLSKESSYWEQRMLDSFSTALISAKNLDNEELMFAMNDSAVEATLETMQIRWTAYRESLCHYEQSLWMGGSGSGPAVQACYMTETARQTLKLEGWWSQ